MGGGEIFPPLLVCVYVVSTLSAGDSGRGVERRPEPRLGAGQQWSVFHSGGCGHGSTCACGRQSFILQRV